MGQMARRDGGDALHAVAAELERLEGEVVRFLTTFGQALDQLREQVLLLQASPGPAGEVKRAPAALIPAAEPVAQAAGAAVAPEPEPRKAAAGAPVEGPRGRILIIDDEAFILTVIRDVLQATGFEVLTAKNGLEGIETARRERPEVIILDVMMSGIDGYETCRRLKREEATRDAAVVMLTALEKEQFNTKAFKAGAGWTVTKSLDPAKLISTVGLAMDSRRRKGP
jgi:CheY-like chemotaxis protein